MSGVSISSTTRWLITFTVMVVAIMEVLDITIVNVSLHDMMGTFGATISDITWVITAYVVSAAIVMPLTGFLVNSIGQKKLLLINIIGFMITSACCGLSSSLFEIIVFRALQGIFGASLIPLSQFILRTTFPPKQLGKAMAVWAMGILVGPILGPTLGGYITEHLNWHWVFFINVPVCALAILLTFALIQETPLSKKPIDWLGIALLAIGVGSFQAFIEEGYHYDWFASFVILFLCLLSIFAIAAFIIHSLNNPDSVIDLRIFTDRQFVICTLILLFFSLALFGALVMQPLMVEVLMGYPPSLTGLLMAPRGFVCLLFTPFVPLLLQRFNAKMIIFTGTLICALGTFLMTTWNLDLAFSNMVWPSIIQGLGMALVFTPVSTIVFANLHPRYIAAAAGMFSFGRSIGLSIGVAILSTVLIQETQIHWNQLGLHLNTFNPALQTWLAAQHLSLTAPQTSQQLAGLLGKHASMLAYLNVYYLSAICFIMLAPLILLIPKGRANMQTQKNIEAH
jgi:DHA2 family multidrug resistance protein